MRTSTTSVLTLAVALLLPYANARAAETAEGVDEAKAGIAKSDGSWQLHRDIWNDNPPAKN